MVWKPECGSLNVLILTSKGLSFLGSSACWGLLVGATDSVSSQRCVKRSPPFLSVLPLMCREIYLNSSLF